MKVVKENENAFKAQKIREENAASEWYSGRTLWGNN